jgi:ABC-2 type transport system ATP-binding protein
MPAIDVRAVQKSFGALKAVDQVSFQVRDGEIFGLLGPNGAGKTTLIRMILDIIKPDQGQTAILGGEMTEAKKNRIGYMPEERGLYQEIKLERCLVYLGTLKGLSVREAKQRLQPYLERFDLLEYKDKKVKELSKGMQQKAQIIATLQHDPELVIIDEPFSGLDPVNTQMVKDLLQDLRAQGVAIMMSTHQMHQVEALCDRLLLIHQGQQLLYGALREIQEQFTGNAVWIRSSGELPTLDGVLRKEKGQNGSVKLLLAPKTSPQELLDAFVREQVPLQQFEVAVPSLNEIFIEVVQRQEGAGA